MSTTEHSLLNHVERLRAAQRLIDDPFVKKVLDVAIEAIETAIIAAEKKTDERSVD